MRARPPHARASVLLAMAIFVSGCGNKATQVIVSIDAEPGVRLDSASLHLVVLGGVGRTTAPTASRFDRVLTPGTAADPAYPFELALAPLDGDVGRSYSVTATAETATNSFVGRVRIIGGYVEGETLRVRLLLEDACRSVVCEDEQTCRGGECVSARADAEVDAGMTDAGEADFGNATDAGEDSGAEDGGALRDAGADGGELDASVSDAGLSCTAPFLDCEAAPGCETNRETDPNHCGACGNVCAWGRCVSGVCDDAVEIVGGTGHTCVRRARGGVECWGWNNQGQLGDGTMTDRTRPTAVSAVTDAVELSAGERHTCARRTSGSVACWGWNAQGQLGDGTMTDRPTATPVLGIADAVELTARTYNTCARRASGAVMCWGRNTEGQIGDGSAMAAATEPRAVSGLTDAVEIASGGYFTCARRSGGTVVCWGDNGSGQIGDGSTGGVRSIPAAAVSGVAGARALVAGGNTACVAYAAGNVSCWGNNGSGEVGDGTIMGPRTTPVDVVGLTDALTVVAGYQVTCARRAAGPVACWGGNTEGQIGDGTMTSSATPVAVLGLDREIALGAGDSHVCALRASGAVVCWGSNRNGQLGDGTRIDRAMPVPVVR